MIDETFLYLGITLALAAMLFVFGILFHVLYRYTESPVYRKALRMMIFTYCFFGLVNVLELANYASRSATDNVLVFRITTLIIAVCQAFLFTFTMILFINAAYVTRRRVIRELIPVLSLSAVFAVICFTLPASFVKISAGLFTVFYICLLIRYIRLFAVTWRNALRKLDNFFSGREAEHLRWVNVSFYAALSIGLLALATSLAPGIRIGFICSVIYYVFYAFFAIRFIGYGFVYKRLEEALSEENITGEPENKNPLPSLAAAAIETGLKDWMEKKQYLQPGITVRDVSFHIGTNNKYLSVYLNQRLNKSFRTWINELRIEEARRLLLEYPDMPVKEISAHVGFAKNNHFYDLFLKSAGQTPHAWRKSAPNHDAQD
jgi:AraC-like DNA-binding protein